jgi:Na+/proline symporter
MRGGVSAVIWTDVVQMFIYIIGAGAVAIALLKRIDGGWTEVVRAGSETARFTWLNMRLDFSIPYTIWAG